MNDACICSQSLEGQRPDFVADAQLRVIWKLYSILQCKSLRDQMIAYEIKDAAWEELKRDVEISRLLGSFGQCFGGEAMSGDMTHSGREDFLLRMRKGWRFRMVV
jgi:hypothetical protein